MDKINLNDAVELLKIVEKLNPEDQRLMVGIAKGIELKTVEVS